MKKTISLLLLIFTVIGNANSQNKSKFYFLGETGLNQVNNKNKLNFALGTEYYISNKSSLILKLKYFKNGIDFFQKGTSCGKLGLFCSKEKKLIYKSTILKIPLNYKWESDYIFNNLSFFFTSGLNLDFTLNEEFIEVKNITPNKSSVNLGFNVGLGFAYKLSSSLDILTFGNLYSGSAKSVEKIGFIFNSKIRTREASLSIGFRYKL